MPHGPLLPSRAEKAEAASTSSYRCRWPPASCSGEWRSEYSWLQDHCFIAPGAAHPSAFHSQTQLAVQGQRSATSAVLLLAQLTTKTAALLVQQSVLRP